MRRKQMRPKLGGGAYADFTPSSPNQFSCKVEHIKCKQQQVKETNDKLQHLEHLQNNLTSLKFIPLKIRIFF